MTMRTTLALMFIALVPSAGLSQKLDEFDAYFADISILQDKSVQADVVVTAAQRNAMNTHADWLNVQRQDIVKNAQAGKLTEQDATKRMGNVLKTLKEKVLGELNRKQLVRLREISLQRNGFLSLLDQMMAERIGVTTAQLTTLRDAFRKNEETAQKIKSGALNPIIKKYDAMKSKSKAEEETLKAQAKKELDAAMKKAAPDLINLGKNYEALIIKTLSKGQMASFEGLKGKPFKPKAA